MSAPTTIYSAATVGLEAIVIVVEADIGRSLPNIAVVGLPDTAVQEARERVRAAIRNSGFEFPKTRVTVNLAPSDVRKEGSLYDLPVALAILAAGGELPARETLRQSLAIGELALDGTLRPVSGVLAIALLAKRRGFSSVIVPAENAAEAALVEGLTVYGAGSLSVARASGSAIFPARFLLVTAENPCPCGFAGQSDTTQQCSCSPTKLFAYQRRLSGPLLDRIDLHLTVPRLPTGDLSTEPSAEASSLVRDRVTVARQRQRDRFAGTTLVTNSEMGAREVRRFCPLSAEAQRLLTAATDRLRLSARAYFRTLKLARTIADLADSPAIGEAHLAEAIQYRAETSRS